jgi:hypothetical protein
MKVLLAENTLGYNSALAALTEKGQRLQAALAAYTALGIATVPTTADLPSLWNSPKLFLERMLTGGQPVTLSAATGNLAVEPGKVYDLLQKPAGTAAFFAKIDELRELGSSWISPGVDPGSYEVNGGTVEIKQAVLDSLLESYRYYATTPRQKTVWDALQLIAGGLNTIRQSGGFGNSFDAPLFLKNALESQGIADTLNPVRASAAYIVTADNLRG